MGERFEKNSSAIEADAPVPLDLPPAATSTSSTDSSSSTGSNSSRWWSSSSTESSIPSQTAKQPQNALRGGKPRAPAGMIIPAPNNVLPPAVPHNIVFVGCPLCLEPAIQPCVTRCGHVFCGPCITEALDAKANCPICRLDAEPKHLKKIFPTDSVSARAPEA